MLFRYVVASTSAWNPYGSRSYDDSPGAAAFVPNDTRSPVVVFTAASSSTDEDDGNDNTFCTPLNTAPVESVHASKSPTLMNRSTLVVPTTFPGSLSDCVVELAPALTTAIVPNPA